MILVVEAPQPVLEHYQLRLQHDRRILGPGILNIVAQYDVTMQGLGLVRMGLRSLLWD